MTPYLPSSIYETLIHKFHNNIQIRRNNVKNEALLHLQWRLHLGWLYWFPLIHKSLPPTELSWLLSHIFPSQKFAFIQLVLKKHNNKRAKTTTTISILFYFLPQCWQDWKVFQVQNKIDPPSWENYQKGVGKLRQSPRLSFWFVNRGRAMLPRYALRDKRESLKVNIYSWDIWIF